MGEGNGIRLPKLGLTMIEGMLVEWLVKPGQSVMPGDLLYVCETEKIANEIESERAGTIGELVVSVGETVPVGALLATWQGETAAPADTRRASHGSPPPAAPVAAQAAGSGVARIIATPHARKLARERGVDLALLTGSGPRGRIKAVDVPAAGIAMPANAAPAPASLAGLAQPVALSAAQRTVATRMSQSAREVPHFYLEAAADLGALLDLHQQVKARAGLGTLTLTHWLVQAIGLALAEHGPYRRVWHGDGVIELAVSDVALAAAGARGLYVGVAREVGSRALRANLAGLDELIRKAREGRLSAEESTGGATCLSNLGATRVRRVWPIILPGQSSIFGVGRAESLARPDASGNLRAVRELPLVLGCDHRVLNGIDGARLLEAVIARLEDPIDLLTHPGF